MVGRLLATIRCPLGVERREEGGVKTSRACKRINRGPIVKHQVELGIVAAILPDLAYSSGGGSARVSDASKQSRPLLSDALVGQPRLGESPPGSGSRRPELLPDHHSRPARRYALGRSGHQAGLWLPAPPRPPAHWADLDGRCWRPGPRPAEDCRHGSLTTTQRYLHPNMRSIVDAGQALSAHLGAS